MDFSRLGNMLKSMYCDEFDIFRNDKSFNEDGTTKVGISETPIYPNIPCKLSYSRSDSPQSQKEDENRIQLIYKIFCDVSVDVKKGDFILIRKKDGSKLLASYSGTANLPQVYPTHQEITLAQIGSA